MPIPSVPGRRAAIPKPFQRSSISIQTSEKRDWQHVTAGDLRLGDVVAGNGVVRAITPLSERSIVFTCGDPESVNITLSPETSVYAFTRVTNG